MDNLLDQVIEFYLSSYDFNGLPIYSITGYNPDEMKTLIEQGMVEALRDELNPHIKRFNKTASIEDQRRYANEEYRDVCFYPTPLALSTKEKDDGKPYTKLLQSGWGQYEVRFFEVEVLEQYFNDPKYIIFDYGYRGSISIRDEFVDGDLIKDYGMAYPVNLADGNIDRAVAVFVRDLAHISEKAQLKWKSREIEDQSAWKVNGGFIKNLLIGDWVSEIWVYDALLMEQVIINQICDAIGIRNIFSKTWDPDNCERPEGFRTILFPTRKNYYDFVAVLEKITCNNLSEKAFTTVQFYTKAIEKEDDREGSISLLGRWLKENGILPGLVDDRIVAPLKKVRKIRQIPAHEIYINQYDKAVYSAQNDLITEVFQAIHYLRMILGKHKRANGIAVPDYLDDESKIVIY